MIALRAFHRVGIGSQIDELLIAMNPQYQEFAFFTHRWHLGPAKDLFVEGQQFRLACGLEIHNFYVPAGGDVPDREANDKFDHKIRFLGAMTRWCREEKVATRPLVLLGDLNVAPLGCDVWNHKRLRRSVGHSPLECEQMARLLRAGGFVDAARHFVLPPTPLYTWWGYRFPQAFAKDYGWRLDHAWITPAALPRLRALEVVKETRTWERPSDHVPVVLDLD